jgi:DNA excision repair protein ERCC-4
MTVIIILYMLPRIVVDRRERSSSIPELLIKAGITVNFATLKVGDYIISSTSAVERKTVQDLVSSIYDGRLLIQCSELIKYFTSPLVIVEGDIKDLELFQDSENGHGYSDKSPLIYGSISTVILDFRIPLVNTPSAKHTTNLLVAMARKSLQERSVNEPLLKKIRKNRSEYLQQLSVLTSLPGVGPKLAGRMLGEFNTPRRALNASSAELAKISGFGFARAQRVRKILDKKFTEIEGDQLTLLEHLEPNN